jgi:hypothetical protein
MVTFKDLQKLVQGEVQASSGKVFSLLQKLQGKGFWYWDSVEHKKRDRIDNGNCCFNHIIGLPRKDGIEKPLLDYERILYKALLQQGYLNSYPYQHSQQQNQDNNNTTTYTFKEKHLWIKKATCLGMRVLPSVYDNKYNR